MSNLISRQAAIDALLKCGEYYNGNNEASRGVAQCIGVVYDLPSAQPEIIRCKDCKNYVIYTLFERSQGWCERLCDEFDKSLARGTEPDDYCSRAEPYKGEK